LYRSNFYND